MAVNEREIPKYVFEDLLLRRRLERNLNTELESLNRLLTEQVELLQKRKELCAEVNAAVMLRWRNEEDAMPESENPTTEEVGQ